MQEFQLEISNFFGGQNLKSLTLFQDVKVR